MRGGVENCEARGLSVFGEGIILSSGATDYAARIYALNDAAQAHTRMEGGDHIGKIVLRVD